MVVSRSLDPSAFPTSSFDMCVLCVTSGFPIDRLENQNQNQHLSQANNQSSRTIQMLSPKILDTMATTSIGLDKMHVVTNMLDMVNMLLARALLLRSRRNGMDTRDHNGMEIVLRNI